MTNYPAEDVPEVRTTGSEAAPLHAAAMPSDRDESAGLAGARETDLDSEDDPGLADDDPGPAHDEPGLTHDEPGFAHDEPGFAHEDPGLAHEDPGPADDPDLIVVDDSTAAEPDAEPAAAEPATAEPATAEPATAEPAAAEPATAEPAMAEAVTAAAEPAGATDGAVLTGQGPPRVAEVAGGTTRFQERWLAIQSEFVDDPQHSVSAAAGLVEEAIETVVAQIRQQESTLRGTWDGPMADTEVLRKALIDYRGFLDRLAAM